MPVQGLDIVPASGPGLSLSQSPAWNVLATAKNGEQRQLARMLKRFGDFHWTRFLGVLVGRVEEHETFLTQLARCEETKPGFLHPLARLVPIERMFSFTMESLAAQLAEAVKTFTDRMGSGSFCVRVERRGHVGELHSQLMEKELAKVLLEALATQGLAATIALKNPDAIIAVEIVGDECGVGLLPRALRDRFPFIKVQ